MPRARECPQLDGDDCLDARLRLHPYRTDRVGRTRSAANGEDALLSKLLIFFHYGQAGAEKRSRACLAPNLWFIRMTTGVRLGNHARAAWRRKGSHQMPYKNLRNSASRLSASD